MESFAPTLGYDYGGNGGELPLPRLTRISAPTLALAGGESPAWATDGAAAIADAVPDGRARILEGQGHGAADEVLIPVFREFFV